MLTERFDDAVVYALALHRKQVRKGTTIPYISHLFAVTSLVIEHGGDEDESIAAVLHDSIEDQGGAIIRTEIADRFGERVAFIVESCSDTDMTPKPEWRVRKEAYIAHLSSADSSVRLVSGADKLHNARSISRDVRVHGEAYLERFQGGREGILWYYRAVLETLRIFGSSSLIDELDRAVVELESLLRTGG